MTFAPGQLRRQMTFGEIVSGSLTLYRRNFATFLALVAVMLPIGMGVSIVMTVIVRTRPNMLVFDALLLLMLLEQAANIVAIAVLACAVSDIADGLPATFNRSYGRILSHMRHLILSIARVFGLLVVAVFIVGMVGIFPFFLIANAISDDPSPLLVLAPMWFFMAIPVVYLTVRWALFPQAVVIENFASGGAMSYSTSLVKGHWWRTFGVVAAVTAAALLPGGIIGRIVPSVASAIAVTVIDLVVIPFAAGAYTLLFFDLQSRERERVSIA